MSNQPEHDNQQPETITSEEMRQSILAELEASKQEIAELSDEQLVEIAGGGLDSQGVGINGAFKGLATMACCAAVGTLHKAMHDPDNIHSGSVIGGMAGLGALGLYHIGSTLVSQSKTFGPQLKRQNSQQGEEMQPLVPHPHTSGSSIPGPHNV
jgi:hypothetical protein